MARFTEGLSRFWCVLNEMWIMVRLYKFKRTGTCLSKISVPFAHNISYLYVFRHLCYFCFALAIFRIPITVVTPRAGVRLNGAWGKNANWHLFHTITRNISILRKKGCSNRNTEKLYIMLNLYVICYRQIFWLRVMTARRNPDGTITNMYLEMIATYIIDHSKYIYKINLYYFNILLNEITINYYQYFKTKLWVFYIKKNITDICTKL
jgi:hypothetical protein